MMISGECLIISSLLITPILYEISQSFRYYFKFFVYYFIIMITSIGVIPIMIWKPKDVKNLLLASTLCKHISRILGLHWELQGKEHLEREEACVIVANHQSSLDILGMFELWPIMGKCTVVAKRELFLLGRLVLPPGSVALYLLIVSTRRHHVRLSIVLLFNSRKIRFLVADFLSDCYFLLMLIKLWVFPEGTRKNTGEIHSFKKGAFHAAVSAQMPLLPVVFTQFYFLRGSRKQLDVGYVRVTVLPPISTEGLTAAEIPRLMEETRVAMTQTFQQTSGQLKAEVLADEKTD